jgi:uncharacterized membrane protein YjgN (DUF898 family)
MKHHFQFDLAGGQWWRLWTMYWVPTLLLLVISFLAPVPKTGTEGLGSFLAVTLSIGFLQTLVTAWFQIPIQATVLPRLSVGGRAFGFRGDSLEFTRINAVGFFLSVVTFGVYLPWYSRNVLAYLASETTFDGNRPDFLGKGGALLGRVAVWFLLALVATVVIIAGTALVLAGTLKNADTKTTLVLTLVTFFLVLVLTGSLLYVIYRWMVHFRWSDRVLRWNTTFWRSFGFVTGQVVLTFLTLGIYGPAAFLRAYRYFVARTVVEKDGVAVVRFSFEGRVGEGFLLFWGQGLLTLVTLGFYWPWALGRLGPWLASATAAEEVLGDGTPVPTP